MGSDNTLTFTDNSFDQDVLKSDVPVLVDFWAEWCGPFKMLAPLLDEIATEQAGHVKVAKVNVDKNPSLAERYHIQSVPTLLYFAKGAVRHQTVGVVGKQTILSKLEEISVAE